jgi:hypothetical protein
MRSNKALAIEACSTGKGLDTVRLEKLQNWGA